MKTSEGDPQEYVDLFNKYVSVGDTIVFKDDDGHDREAVVSREATLIGDGTVPVMWIPGCYDVKRFLTKK